MKMGRKKSRTALDVHLKNMNESSKVENEIIKLLGLSRKKNAEEER